MDLPSLKFRGQDILKLADYFVAKYAAEYSTSPIRFSEQAQSAMLNYAWPGNVRQLENLICNLLITSQNRVISSNELPFARESEEDPEQFNLELEFDHFEKELIQSALEESNFSPDKAANLLGITTKSLKVKMEKFGLSH